jgi:D-serine deaminase-like pyridoxal phosphate-dependent protein
MPIFDQIETPTLLLDAVKARRNIHRMAEKARRLGVRFRPHFKTHQSAEIGEWFRPEGVTAITVSSVDMAAYFARSGWQDITIAFSTNLRQVRQIGELAARVHLELLVESVEAASFLQENLATGVDAWIKVDSGAGRTGLPWTDFEVIANLARQIEHSSRLHLRGILTHAGHTYWAKTPQNVRRLTAESVGCMLQVKRGLLSAGLVNIEVSVGDTPGCSLSEDFAGVSEIRPGNFIFFDAEQFAVGACAVEDIAVALACPVVAKHPERNEAVIYGGAIHLSKECMPEDGRMVYGKVSLPYGNGWGQPLAGAYVDRLSQEHGLLHLEAEDLDRLRIGDLVCILPVHSCLTVQVMGEYLTLDGHLIRTLNKNA